MSKWCLNTLTQNITAFLSHHIEHVYIFRKEMKWNINNPWSDWKTIVFVSHFNTFHKTQHVYFKVSVYYLAIHFYVHTRSKIVNLSIIKCTNEYRTWKFHIDPEISYVFIRIWWWTLTITFDQHYITYSCLKILYFTAHSLL